MLHVLEEFSDGVVVWLGTDIEHQTLLRLQELGNSLEEPLMTVDLTIIPLLYSENEIDPTSLKCLLFKAEVPGAGLEQMQAVLREICLRHRGVHQLLHRLHLPFPSFLDHEASGLELVKVEELVLSSIILKPLLYLVITITDAAHHHVLLLEFDVWVHIQNVVVLNQASKRELQLGFLFVVHRDADSELWLRALEQAEISRSGDHACVFDFTWLAVGPETTGTHCGVVRRRTQAHGLVRHELGRLPIRLISFRLEVVFLVIVNGMYRPLGAFFFTIHLSYQNYN